MFRVPYRMIQIYVVSVKSFTARHEHIERMAQQFGFSFEYVWRYDADELTEADLDRVSDSLSHKSASNVLKHFYAQELFLKTGYEIALVLEDDVILFDSFFEQLGQIIDMAKNLSPGWLIFLGGADNKLDSRFFASDKQFLVKAPITTAEAYLIDRRGCEMRSIWLETHSIDRQADHQLKLVDQQLGLGQYCVSRPIATQGSITGLFGTSLDASRSKHSPLFLKFRYTFNRIRRQILPRVITRFLKGS